MADEDGVMWESHGVWAGYLKLPDGIWVLVLVGGDTGAVADESGSIREHVRQVANRTLKVPVILS